MSVPIDWHRTFFAGLASEFWHAFPTHAMTRAEVDFALSLLAPAPGALLLDVPCGDGRHARELAKRGFAVTAVDASPAMIAHARADTGADTAVALHELDMRALPWRAELDGAVCLGNSFGYLGDEGDAEFLAAVRRALRPGARFLLDAVTLEVLLQALVPRRWYEAGGILFLSEVEYDAVAGVVRSDYTFVRGEERERRTAWVRVRSCRETSALLRAAGFGEVAVLGPDGAPFRQGDSRAWFLATPAA
jgi:SAM-dependent methyltransferase